MEILISHIARTFYIVIYSMTRLSRLATPLRAEVVRVAKLQAVTKPAKKHVRQVDFRLNPFVGEFRPKRNAAAVATIRIRENAEDEETQSKEL